MVGAESTKSRWSRWWTPSAAVAIAGALLLGVASSAGGQAVVSVGIQAGPTVSDFWGDEQFNPWDRAGVTAGGLLNVELSPVWSLQGEIQYTTKGGRENNERQPEGDVSNELYLSYLETPILVRAAVLPEASVRPVVFGGIAWAFRLSCTFDDFPDGDSDERSCSEAGFDLKSSDFAVVFGGGVDIDAGPGAILVEARGTVGLKSIDQSGEVDVKNRSIALVAGYVLPLNGP